MTATLVARIGDTARVAKVRGVDLLTLPEIFEECLSEIPLTTDYKRSDVERSFLITLTPHDDPGALIV
jgi:hypothetical protein